MSDKSPRGSSASGWSRRAWRSCVHSWRARVRTTTPLRTAPMSPATTELLRHARLPPGSCRDSRGRRARAIASLHARRNDHEPNSSGGRQQQRGRRRASSAAAAAAMSATAADDGGAAAAATRAGAGAAAPAQATESAAAEAPQATRIGRRRDVVTQRRTSCSCGRLTWPSFGPGTRRTTTHSGACWPRTMYLSNFGQRRGSGVQPAVAARACARGNAYITEARYCSGDGASRGATMR